MPYLLCPVQLTAVEMNFLFIRALAKQRPTDQASSLHCKNSLMAQRPRRYSIIKTYHARRQASNLYYPLKTHTAQSFIRHLSLGKTLLTVRLRSAIWPPLKTHPLLPLAQRAFHRLAVEDYKTDHHAESSPMGK